MRNRLAIIVIAVAVLAACGKWGPLRYPPARWLADSDRTPIELPPSKKPYKPQESAYELVYEQVERFVALTDRLGRGADKIAVGGRQEALNINNFDEVPDSTWFTNRLGRFDLSTREIAHPFDPKEAPDLSESLTILAARVRGLAPRALVRDRRGRLYLLTFDPADHPGLATGAELIAARIVRAVGYNVAPSFLLHLHRRQLRLDEKATTRKKYRRVRPLTEEDVDNAIKRIAGGEGGTPIRTVATLFPAGRLLGPFSFSGRRRGDANDRIPHEHRRELRGYQVVSSLINNSHMTQNGTMDTFLSVDGERGYILHILVDFSTAFGDVGSWQRGSTSPYSHDYGYPDALATMFSLGVYDPTADDVDAPKQHGLGFLESKDFDPGSWSPAYPNAAFAYMTERDALWAAAIVMRLSDEAIRAIVAEAHYPDSTIADYVARTLIERRDKIGRYWFAQLNPLGEVALERRHEGFVVRFTDYAVHYGFVDAATTRYRSQLGTMKGQVQLTPWRETQERRAVLDDTAAAAIERGRTYTLRIQTRRAGEEFWRPSVDVSLRRGASGITIVGMRRRYKL